MTAFLIVPVDVTAFESSMSNGSIVGIVFCCCSGGIVERLFNPTLHLRRVEPVVFGASGMDDDIRCLTGCFADNGDGGTTTVAWLENRRAAVRKET